MNLPTLARLRNAQTCAQHALDNAGGLGADLVAGACQPLHAALYDLAILGEALSKVPQEVRSLAPGISWNAVVGMRNHVVHAYRQVDHGIIADVLARRLVPLIAALEELIQLVEGVEP